MTPWYTYMVKICDIFDVWYPFDFFLQELHSIFILKSQGCTTRHCTGNRYIGLNFCSLNKWDKFCDFPSAFQKKKKKKNKAKLLLIELPPLQVYQFSLCLGIGILKQTIWTQSRQKVQTHIRLLFKLTV